MKLAFLALLAGLLGTASAQGVGAYISDITAEATARANGDAALASALAGLGHGTVSSFSFTATSLAPLFTCTTATPTTTPSTVCTAAAAVAQNAVLAGPASGGSGAYGFRLLTAGDIPTLPYLSSAGLSTYNAITDGGAVGDGTTDDTAALNVGCTSAIAAGKAFFIPATTFKTTGTVNCQVSPSAQLPVVIYGIPGRSKIQSTSTTTTILQVGNNAATGQISDGRIQDLILAGPSVAGSIPQNGQAALLLNRMTQITVDGLTSYGTDIGIDAINNCYGLRLVNARMGFGGGHNVSVNMRTGAQSGNQWRLIDSWLGGAKASVQASPNSDGLIITGGQMGLTSAASDNGAVVMGRDYLAGTNGNMGTVTVDGVDFEGVSGWIARGYGQVNLHMGGDDFLSNGSVQTAGILKVENAAVSNIDIQNNEWGGPFSNAVPIVITGDYGSTMVRSGGAYGGNLSFNGAAWDANNGVDPLVITNKISGSVAVKGTADYRPYSSQLSVHYTDGLYSRYNGTVLQTSTDGATWSAYARCPTNGSGSMFYAECYSGADFAAKANACLTAAYAVGGKCDLTGVGGPTFQTTGTGINVPAKVTAILPHVMDWGWSSTDTTLCPIKIFSGATVLGDAPGGGGSPAILDTVPASSGVPTSTMKAMICNDHTNLDNYVRASGIEVQNNGAATFVNAPVDLELLSDESDIERITVINKTGNGFYFQDIGCGAVLNLLHASASNGTYGNPGDYVGGGIPFWMHGTTNCNGAVQISNSTFRVPGPGFPNMKFDGIINGAKVTSTYEEGNGPVSGDNTPMNYIGPDVHGITFDGMTAQHFCNPACDGKFVFENHSPLPWGAIGTYQGQGAFMNDIANGVQIIGTHADSNAPYFGGGTQYLPDAVAKTLRLWPTTAATCTSALGGQFQYTHTNSSTKDVLQFCAQDATGTYAWRPLY